MMKKSKRLASLLLASMMLLTACGGGSGTTAATETTAAAAESAADTASAETAEGEREYADTVRVVLNSEPSNIDPHNNTRLTSWAVQEEVFDKLVTKVDGEIVADLATDWEQIDDRTTRFYLRDDVTFHDGSKLTAEDVAFSLKRACESSGSQTFFIAFDAGNINVVDEYTVDVATKEPFAAVLNYLASARGAILCKSAVESMGDEEYGRNPVGSGPFKFVSWTTGSEIVLERNEDYWGEKPAYQNLQFRFVTEASNRAIELETGGADIVYSIVANDAERLKSNPDVQIISGPAYQFIYVSFNMSDETLKNEKLRQALVQAIDIPSLVDAVYGESAQVADSYMSPNVAYHASMEAKTYDPEAAKALLEEAGYGDGLELTIKMADDTTFSTMAEIVQGMWAEIGVTANIEIMEQATYLEQANVGEVQIAMASTNAVSGDPDNALMIWRTTAVNAIQACDPQIDAYLDEGAKEFDSVKRAEIYEEAQQYLRDKDYCVPIAFPNVTYGCSNQVENLECSPGSTPDLAKVVIYQ